jgi:DNA-directed RNA polymerase specialized sigma24 family protein
MERTGFERLCAEHYANVVRTAYLITGDLAEATDIAQEAFARAFERWTTVSALDAPEAWVHRVAANMAVSWWRRLRVRRSRPLPEAGVVPPPEPPDLVHARYRPVRRRGRRGRDLRTGLADGRARHGRHRVGRSFG